ncbi:MAG: T9SS type A sorting domain-containing protein [Bacteroidales bacterium]|nr:T9SS type A sorting domain-containing protein [Bacteroidales bacterium]
MKKVLRLKMLRLPEKRLALILLFAFGILITSVSKLSAQKAYFNESVPTVKNIIGDEASNSAVNFITVPITMAGPGLGAVTSFNFFLEFDASKLTFEGYLPGAVNNVAVNTQGNFITLNWQNPAAPVNCINPVTMLNLQFNRIGNGDVALTFLPGSSVGNLQGLLAVTYVNGIVQTYQLTVSANPAQGGMANGGGEYVSGQSVNLQATPSEGYEFVSWTNNGQVVSSNASFSYTMPATNVSLIANFQLKNFQVTTNSLPSSGGTTSGGGFYTFGQNVSVSAIASTGYTFLNWTLNGQIVSTASTYSFTMPASDLSLWANFQQNEYALTLDFEPPLSGSVSGAGNYFYNASVNVVASPSTGYHFLHWLQNGNIVSISAAYSFLMPANALHLTAVFEINQYTIELQANNPEGGNVSGGGEFPYNTQISVNALPNEGFAFIAWTENGLPVSFSHNYAFSVVSNRILTAVFEVEMICQKPVNIIVTALGESFATLSWISPSEVLKWDILWGSAGFDTAQGGAFVPHWMENTITLEDLNPQTSYDFYVRAYCNDALMSEWAGPVQFSTHYVSLAEKSGASTFWIYPNPLREYFTLESLDKLHGLLTYEIINSTGRVVEKSNLIFSKKTVIDTRHLPAGIYFFRGIMNNHVFSEKLILQD